MKFLRLAILRIISYRDFPAFVRYLRACRRIDDAHGRTKAFRFNFRKMTDGERFTEAMRQIVGRRLTYEELTGKTERQPG